MLATTLTTMIVLVPLAFNITQRSMSASMLGGCFASTILTLIILPPIFVWFLKRKKMIAQFSTGNKYENR